MEIKLIKGILHILEAKGALPVYSQKELDIRDEVIAGFITKHIKKIISSEISKNGELQKNSFVLQNILLINKNIDNFMSCSIRISEHLFKIMKENANIPSADLLIVMLEIDCKVYLAMIKFNYKEGYTHYVEYDEVGATNKIIVHKTIFASENQKNDEGAIINLENLSVKVIEKQYEINGEKQNYFSNMFLGCNTELSQKESLKVIKNVAMEFGRKHYNDSFSVESKVKAAIFETVEEAGVIDIKNIAEATFRDRPEIKKHYVERIAQAGVKEKILVNGEKPERKFNKHKIRTDNGIELTLPMELYRNKDVVEFINNPDGTVSIIIKNISRMISR